MIITLTTDIGWEYAAEIKGKILSINPDAKIVDITHEIMPQNIRQGAFVLYSIAPYYKNAIHIGVVDPGVGTERKCLLIECKNCFFIGPDNGLLIPAAKRMEIKKIYELKVSKNASPVFHGRDVFAPTAAKISLGKKACRLGRKINEYVNLDFEEAIVKGGKIEGKVIFIDRFGNIITNVKKEQIKEKEFRVRIGEIEKDVNLYPSYGYARKKEILAVVSSSGFIEIARREGNAAEYFNAKEDKLVEIFL
ncbi:MAG: hypothetical protein DRN11_04860 [Thermoplasmata archaeon]|nr:MAG: hypothetical protein DRN11_04860 [Thermoplasmata archaeon]